jgi:tetratricopeptide (TPR) repeat protein
MLRFLRARRPAERLATSFRWLDRALLPDVRAPHYEGRNERGAYALSLDRESYFAWETLIDGRRFDDFVLEADVEIDPSNGHCAAGVLFRHLDDENFYSFLVSTRGNFRVDALFNNHPLRLVEWTRLPGAEEDAVEAAPRALRVVAHGSRIVFFVEEEWVAEIEDEHFTSGSIGFAAQNFAGAAAGRFRLRRLAIDARPLAVEREHHRATYYLPVSPAARLRLAETLFASGNANAAAVQLRKALKQREGSVRERFLLAECYARLSLYPESLAEVAWVLAREPRHPEARREQANLLYLANRLPEARDALREGMEDGSIAPGSASFNLLGNAEYGLGNWGKAAEAYLRAIELQPDSSQAAVNAARALERAERSAEAVDMYRRAARLLFAEERFDELSLVIPRVRALAPEDAELRAIEGKMLYREGKRQDAHRILAELADEGSGDSAVHYLVGLILAGEGGRERALPYLERAAGLEPSYPLYHFRLAETLHLVGRDPWPPLERALELAPADPWANNLAGLLRMEGGAPAAAVPFLQKALHGAPAEEDIRLNLSEALSLAGDPDAALTSLDQRAGSPPESARIHNQRGNILARRADYAAAAAAYERAIRLDPDAPTYKENCAAACIEADMIHRAEELLAQLEPEHPSAAVYNMIGSVAAAKGERLRAELAFAAGLEREPGNPDIAVNLALLHRERGNHEKAKEVLLAVLSAKPGHARAASLLARIREEREQRLACASCGREWWAPKELPPQSGIRVRGEPPGEAPAGRCPSCGKVYCVACASAHLLDKRFQCPDCNEALKLSDDPLKWLLARFVAGPNP